MVSFQLLQWTLASFPAKVTILICIPAPPPKKKKKKRLKWVRSNPNEPNTYIGLCRSAEVTHRMLLCTNNVALQVVKCLEQWQPHTSGPLQVEENPKLSPMKLKLLFLKGNSPLNYENNHDIQGMLQATEVIQSTIENVDGYKFCSPLSTVLTLYHTIPVVTDPV